MKHALCDDRLGWSEEWMFDRLGWSEELVFERILVGANSGCLGGGEKRVGI